MQKSLIATGIILISSLLPVIPEDMKLLHSFTYECNGVMRTALAEDGRTAEAEFNPEPCVGTHAYSTFMDSNGNKVYTEIGIEKYADIGRAGGFERNPTKSEFSSVLETYLVDKAEAAIAFNDVDWDSLGGSGTSHTLAVDVGAGTGRFLFGSNLCNGDSVNTVTYNGTSMTRSGKIGAMGANYLFNPSSGSNNLVVNCVGTASNIVINAASYTGANAGPIDNTGNGSGSASSLSLSITATSTSWMIAGLRYDSSGDPFTMTSGTARTDADTPNNNQIIADSNGTCTSCTISATFASGNYTVMGVTVNPAAAATTPSNGTVIWFQ